MVKLKTTVEMIIVDFVGLFWAIVARLLVMTGLVNDALLRLQVMRQPSVKPTQAILTVIVKLEGTSVPLREDVIVGPHRIEDLR